MKFFYLRFCGAGMQVPSTWLLCSRASRRLRCNTGRGCAHPKAGVRKDLLPCPRKRALAGVSSSWAVGLRASVPHELLAAFCTMWVSLYPSSQHGSWLHQASKGEGKRWSVNKTDVTSFWELISEAIPHFFYLLEVTRSIPHFRGVNYTGHAHQEVGSPGLSQRLPDTSDH